MTIKFDHVTFADTHGPLIVGSIEFPIRRTKYFNVRGEGEVMGLDGGRSILCTLLVHDGYTTEKKFWKQIEKIEAKLGVNGTLEEEGELNRTFKTVTFEGFDPIPLVGQEEPGPLLDIGVLTRDDGSLDNGYFGAYLCRFRQLVT